MTWRVDVGDCVDLMAAMPATSVDAVVCDPPYELGFMGRSWDRSGVSYQPETWAEALRVLKPGGHLLAFGGTRTSHRLACAIEDAGFEIRDTICWLYGSGFPKSHNLSGEWDGWGTALKPAHEPIVVARKPLAGTVAANVLEHGTGGLNVDGCRVAPSREYGRAAAKADGTTNKGEFFSGDNGGIKSGELPDYANAAGRWPANVVLDEQAAAMLDQQSGERPSSGGAAFTRGGYNLPLGERDTNGASLGFGDSGGASRFFYTAKASRAERNAGLEGFADNNRAGHSTWAGECNICGCRMMMYGKPTCGHNDFRWTEGKPTKNHHPTVKPVSLMRWLVRLVTPPDGLILDPFAGSGTTGIAAALEGFNFIGCEQDADYAKIAQARINWWDEHGHDALRIVQEQEAAEAERQEIRASGQLDLLGDLA